MSKGVCDAINEIDKNVVLDSASQNYKFDEEIYGAYCPNKICDTNEKLLGSAFMSLIELFKNVDDYDDNFKNDKLSQYAILWFNSKIRGTAEMEAEINNIYNVLTENGWISEYRQYTNKNEDIMKFHFLYLKKFYKFLKGICETITNCSGPSKTEECIKSAKKCNEFYRACILSAPWEEICNPYCNLLSNLKKDYDKIREKYKTKEIPELTLPVGVESCESLCNGKQQWKVEKLKNEELKTSTLTEVSLSVPSVTPTSINNANKLPYIAVPLILIPIILGFSYKYLTHSRRKKSNAKKKMKAIINLCDENKTKKCVKNAFIEKNQSE
ncbi:CIR protein [Plasmodium chabaudi chabaudi]|uniref:CIR protein n=1 Tax=Plasmodium chabaudi chabaudi TaxID=31271 RepID=A0A4V0K4V4_PLACU|nr:CIR protein [Plasmodium chabaudi chabaudi]VTZ67130.1 CIR protein [Plasmodium chabaudi chabaudi]|eukprot:XP_016653240.1 CIR protein [Plasmodium chabaudi chabaudi]